MPRIEWTVLEGGQTETVVANLLFHEYPRAIRVRPSIGDRGIDVLVPRNQPSGSFDVYQIKRFALNLTGSHKGQIDRSFRRLLISLVRKGVAAADWYLVTPLDPTPENLEWFFKMPDRVIDELFADDEAALTEQEKTGIRNWRNAPGRAIEWSGLLFCEGLAAKYAFVADYYLHGGAERVRSAVDTLAQLLTRGQDLTPIEGVSILEPSEAKGHLALLTSALDTDPHYRYFFRVDPARPAVLAEQGLVAATSQPLADGAWLTFTIYARYDEAVNEREIPVALTFDIEQTSSDDIQDWVKYGKPMHGTASIEAGLPGGLAFKAAQARVVIAPSDNATYDFRLRTVTPEGKTIGTVVVHATSSLGLDQTGSWVSGTDPSGVLSVEALLDASNSAAKFRFTMNDPVGAEVVSAVPVFEFLSGLGAQNTLHVAAKHGPFVVVQPLPNSEAPVTIATLRYIRAAARLQEVTSAPLLVLPADEMNPAHVHAVINAAALLDGRTLIHRWDAGTLEPANQFTDGHHMIEFLEELSVSIGAAQVAVGTVKTTLKSATVTRAPDGSATVHPHLHDTAERVLVTDEEEAAWGHSSH